jgi:hypothetical protein
MILYNEYAIKVARTLQLKSKSIVGNLALACILKDWYKVYARFTHNVYKFTKKLVVLKKIVAPTQQKKIKQKK